MTPESETFSTTPLGATDRAWSDPRKVIAWSKKVRRSDHPVAPPLSRVSGQLPRNPGSTSNRKLITGRERYQLVSGYNVNPHSAEDRVRSHVRSGRITVPGEHRSEERRVGKECRSRW